MANAQPLYPEYLIGTAVIIIALSLAIWYRRRWTISGRTFLGLIAFATAWWSTFYLLEISQPAPSVKLLMENIQYFAVVALPTLMLLFTLDYIRVILKPIPRLLLWLEPLLMLLVVWTDPFTHWLRVSSNVYQISPGPAVLTSVHGWAHYVNGGYSLLLMLICCILLARDLFTTPFWGRMRTGFALIAAITAFVGLLFVVPTDLSSSATYLLLAGAVLSQLIIMAGVSQRQTLELIPIARETVLEQMQDPVIVINLEGKISGANPAANALLGDARGKVTGRTLASFGPEWEGLTPSSPLDENPHRELNFTTASGQRYYDAVVSPIKDNKQVSVGSLIVLRETTQQIQAQNELAILRRLSEEFNQASDLRSALQPAMETIHQLSACQSMLIQLVDSAGTLTQAFVYDPDAEGDPISEVQGKVSAGECTVALQNGELNEPREFDPCDCARNVPSQDLVNGKHLAIPLAVSGNSLGVVNLFYADDKPVPDNSLLHLIHTICNSLGVTIERIRLFEVEHSQREQAEMLQNVSRIITSSLDFNEVLDMLLEQVGQLVPYDAANIMWIEGPLAQGQPQPGLRTLQSQCD